MPVEALSELDIIQACADRSCLACLDFVGLLRISPCQLVPVAYGTWAQAVCKCYVAHARKMPKTIMFACKSRRSLRKDLQVLHSHQPQVCEHMPAMEPPAEELQGALQKLETLQQQQQASAAGLQLLASQHRDWQAAVAELLGQVGSSLEDVSDSTPAAHPGYCKETSMVVSGRPSVRSVRSVISSELNDPIPRETESVKLEDLDERGKFTRLNAVSFLRKGPQMPSSHKLVGRGPLSKLVLEFMPDAAENLPLVPLRGWSWLRQTLSF